MNESRLLCHHYFINESWLTSKVGGEGVGGWVRESHMVFYPHGWVMAVRPSEGGATRMSLLLHGWVMADMQSRGGLRGWLCDLDRTCEFYTYESIMLHVWLSHSHIWTRLGAHMNESCHTYEWIMSQIWMNHATRMNESCHTYEWVMSQIWISHVTYMDESCHMCEWVILFRWISQIKIVNAS